MKVFLSHSSVDKAIVHRLAIDLQMSNIDVWLDEWEIRVGDSISQKISRGLDDSELVIVALSVASIGSGWVEREWSSRIGEEASSRQVRILTVRLDDCTAPPLLRDKRHADLRQNYTQGFRDLLESLLRYAQPQVVGVGARIRHGRIVYEGTDPDLPLFRGMLNSIEKGCFVRHDNRLQVHVQTVGPREDFQRFAESTGIDRLVLTSDAFVISSNPAAPTLFRGDHRFVLPRGLVMTDFGSGAQLSVPFDITGSFTVDVLAHASAGRITGTFRQDCSYTPALPLGTLHAWGTFSASVDLHPRAAEGSEDAERPFVPQA